MHVADYVIKVVLYSSKVITWLIYIPIRFANTFLFKYII